MGVRRLVVGPSFARVDRSRVSNTRWIPFCRHSVPPKSARQHVDMKSISIVSTIGPQLQLEPQIERKKKIVTAAQEIDSSNLLSISRTEPELRTS